VDRRGIGPRGRIVPSSLFMARNRISNVGKIGLALGSGAARGWAHLGVVRGLQAAGIEPDVICGTSIGAVVGAAYASGELEAFEAWVEGLDRRRIAGFLDLALRGGVIRARRVFDAMSREVSDRSIEDLDIPFAAVATDLASGHEVWLRQGSMFDALRASVALPGLISPMLFDGRWLVDGGLVNPVPVSVCRALGADFVIAVDLNATLVGRRLGADSRRDPNRTTADATAALAANPSLDSVRAWIQSLGTELRGRFLGDGDASEERDATPSLYDVVANSINIMQVRVTRSRMAGDPPDLAVTPCLENFALLDFHRADEAIAEGRRSVQRALVSAGLDG
jgi:NTE family protein